MKKKAAQNSNTKIAVFFFIFLILIVGVSLVFKFVILVKDGQFDSSKRFTLSISNNKNLEVISLASSIKSVTIFKLKDNAASNKIGEYLKIPVDAEIKSETLNFDQKIDSIFLKTILGYKNLQTNLTIIDLLKLFLAARSIPESNIVIKNISSGLSGEELDKIIGRSVIDDLIEEDNQTIRIVNGTNIAGFGNRLARLITNMGGDVIIVATSDRAQKRSIISYTDEKSYTVQRLQKVLGYDVAKVDIDAIADITITIGEDKANSSPF